MGSAAQGSEQTGNPPHGGPLPLADRYRVVARVGMGGTAVVYRAIDLHTQRVVAVKVLRTNTPLIPEAEARFRREARLAATLTHPHIVRVLDFGYTLPPDRHSRAPWDDEDGPVPFLAMEYIFGSTLKDLVRRRGQLPVEWVWRLGEQLCHALGAAHALGVVHRDVKPQNVMILDAPLELVAKLTDFGIARQVGGDLTTLTSTGEILGTPDYLSPEQVLGEPGGPSSDLYALGIVLYELLTARLPFEAENALAAATRRMVADAPPLTSYRRDVPAALQEVVLVALQREPSERYANAYEFADALRWSREQAPDLPAAPRGTWVLDPVKSRADVVPGTQRVAARSDGVVGPQAPGSTDESSVDVEAPTAILRVAPASIPLSEAEHDLAALSPDTPLDVPPAF